MTLLEKVLEDAAAAGEVRPGLDPAEVAGVILSTIMFNAAYTQTISGNEEPQDGETCRGAALDLPLERHSHPQGGLKPSGALLGRGGGRTGGEELAGPLGRCLDLLPALAEGHDAGVEVGDPGVGEAAEPLSIAASLPQIRTSPMVSASPCSIRRT